MKILFAASESVPFVKTGGLADVVGALAPVLAKEGHDVRVIIPQFSSIPQEYSHQMTHVCDFEVQLGWRRQYCGIEMIEKDGKRYAYMSRRNEAGLDVDGYYTATLYTNNKKETMVAVKSKIGAGNAKTNEGNWLIAQEYRYNVPYATDSFHRNYTIVFHENDIADAMARDNSTEIYVLADE